MEWAATTTAPPIPAAPPPPPPPVPAANGSTSTNERDADAGGAAVPLVDEPQHQPYGARAAAPLDVEVSRRLSLASPSSSAPLDGEADQQPSSQEFFGCVARGRRSRLATHPAPDEPSKAELQADESRGPLVVETRRDTDEEGYSYGQLWRVRYSLISPIYIAFKTAVLVTLPLSILAFSEPTKGYFKSGSLLAVVGTSNTKLYLGQQLSGSIMVMQGAVWMILWGTVVAALGMEKHEGAWWGMAFAAVIFVSFHTNLRSRRLMMSYSIIIMQLMRAYGGATVSMPANVGADLILALCFAMFQAFVPYPMLMSRRTDEVFKRAWRQVGTVCSDLRAGVWSGRAVSANVAAAEVACDDLVAVAKSIPGLLFFVSYEPFERSLYNQLRSERLTLLKRMLVILNATCVGARLFTSMSSSETREAQMQWKSILREAVDEYVAALVDTLTVLGESLEPSETAQRCPFERLHTKKNALLHALQSCRAFVAHRDPDSTDAPAFYSFLYFHLLLALQADELHTYAEQLAAFDPSKYTSTWRRFLEFFFLDFWEDFRNNLLGRVLLRTAADVRNFKEGLKLACAYLVAAAFTSKLNEADSIDTYFFGMSIILGMGLPTVSESIEVGVHRIAGMSFALVIGYIAEWKTSSFVQAMAVVVCGSFIALCFRDSTRYMHVAWYASFIAPSAYGIANNRITMIARVVDSSFAVVAYFIICTMMFPINPYRVLWNRRSLAQQKMADAFTTLASVVQLQLTQDRSDIATAQLAIAAEQIRTISNLLGQAQEWIAISAKEPALIGSPFPTEQVQQQQVYLQHICAGLEIWLFGLQLLHRRRATAPHPLIVKMRDAMRPLLSDLEAASRIVFQDLIDAVHEPETWSVEQSVRRFSDFVLIKGRLDATFSQLHKDMSLAQSRAMRRDLENSGERADTAGMVSQPFIGHLRDNVCVVHDFADNYGAAHSLNPHFYHKPDSARAAAHERTIGAAVQPATPPSAPAAAPANAPPPPSTAGCDISFNLSFRAAPGNLPIDVDVTAFTIVIASVAALTASLEHMVPFTQTVNKFARSRRNAGAFTVRDFFLCRT